MLYITNVTQSVYLFDLAENSLVEQKTLGAEGIYSNTSLLSNGAAFHGTYYC